MALFQSPTSQNHSLKCKPLILSKPYLFFQPRSSLRLPSNVHKPHHVSVLTPGSSNLSHTVYRKSPYPKRVSFEVDNKICGQKWQQPMIRCCRGVLHLVMYLVRQAVCGVRKL